jgi:hypothetical protein
LLVRLTYFPGFVTHELSLFCTSLSLFSRHKIDLCRKEHTTNCHWMANLPSTQG